MEGGGGATNSNKGFAAGWSSGGRGCQQVKIKSWHSRFGLSVKVLIPQSICLPGSSVHLHIFVLWQIFSRQSLSQGMFLSVQKIPPS